MSVVSMKQLLEAGVHFGHQTRRWNPKMKKFIFDERNGIYIIDLQKTMQQLNEVSEQVKKLAQAGYVILFVGTKKQAKEAIQEEAARCGMPYISHRWLGGMLTNFTTIKKRVEYLKKLQKERADGEFEKRTKKEVSLLEKKMEKLERVLGGIMNMDRLPDAVFVVDPKKEYIAVEEARKLKIPIVGIVDTNCDPDVITWPIPANDDAIKAVRLISSIMADSIINGRGMAKDDATLASSLNEAVSATQQTEDAAPPAEVADSAVPELEEEAILAG